MDLHACDETGVQVVRLRFFTVQNLHWESSAWDGEDGRFEEILRELHGVQSSRGHDQLHVFALLYRLKDTEEVIVCEKGRFFKILFGLVCRMLKNTFLRSPKSTSVWIVLS